MLVGAGPLQDGERGAAVEDGADHVGVGQRVGQPVDLQAVFAFVDGVGDIHGEDKSGFAGMGEGWQEREGEGCGAHGMTIEPVQEGVTRRPSVGRGAARPQVRAQSRGPVQGTGHPGGFAGWKRNATGE